MNAGARPTRRRKRSLRTVPRISISPDDLRRSRAFAAIAEIYELELLEEGEFLQFSEETRETVLRILGRA